MGWLLFKIQLDFKTEPTKLSLTSQNLNQQYGCQMAFTPKEKSIIQLLIPSHRTSVRFSLDYPTPCRVPSRTDIILFEKEGGEENIFIQLLRKNMPLRSERLDLLSSVLHMDISRHEMKTACLSCVSLKGPSQSAKAFLLYSDISCTLFYFWLNNFPV